MTKPITINLTLDELKTLDKYVELNDETRPLFDKIRSAYPEPKITFENRGNFDVVSYHDPENSNSGYETYWRIAQPNSFSWWRRYIVPHKLDMVQNTEKEQELEKLYQEQLEQEMIKRNLKTSLQELANGDVRSIYDVVRESKKWCEEHPDESVEDYLTPQGPQGPVGPGPGPKGVIVGYEPTPKTPEFLKFELGKTLNGLIEEWWIDVFTRNSDLSMEESIDCLVTMISSWLPKEQSAAGSQSLGVEDMVDGFNDCLKKIKSKLRNKKET